MARALVAPARDRVGLRARDRLELDLIATAPGGRARAARGGRGRGARRGEGAGRPHLRRLAALQALDVPIVLLVGGATGTGKSTVATEAAHRLGITRVTSTDFIRQTIRAYFPRRDAVVHVSSFEAGGPGDVEAASSSRRAACSSASRPRSSAR